MTETIPSNPASGAWRRIARLNTSLPDCRPTITSLTVTGSLDAFSRWK